MAEMRAILLRDSAGARIPIITDKSLEVIVMEIYQQKRWDIVEVTDNSGSFRHKVVDGVVIAGEPAN